MMDGPDISTTTPTLTPPLTPDEGRPVIDTADLTPAVPTSPATQEPATAAASSVATTATAASVGEGARFGGMAVHGSSIGMPAVGAGGSRGNVLNYGGGEPPRRNGRRRYGGGDGGGGGRSARRAGAARSTLPSSRDLLYVLFKHRVKAAVVGATIFTLAFMAALVLPSKFTSEAQLLVRPGRGTQTIPNGNSPQPTPVVDMGSIVNSEAQIFRSRDIVIDTVRRIGPDRIIHGGPAPAAAIASASQPAAVDVENLTPTEATAARLLGDRIDVRTEPLSNVIKVDYESSDPQLAHDVVEAYVNSFLDLRMRIYTNVSAHSLFSTLTADSEKKLRQLEEQARVLKDQTGVSDVATQKSILLNRIAMLQSTLDTVNAQLAATKSRIGALETQLAQTPHDIPLSHTANAPMGAVSTAQNKLNDLRAELAAKLTNYQDTSPVIVNLRQQIADAEERINELKQSPEGELVGLNPTWAELDKNLKTERANQDGLDAQAAALGVDLAKAQQGQTLINAVEMQMSQLARQQGMADEELKQVLQGANYTTIDQAMSRDRVGNVTISQSASMPEASKPTSPNRKLMLIFGLFAAVVGGAGTALLAEMMDQTVGRPEDLKRLGFTRVVSIPVMRMTSFDAANGSGATTADDESLVGPLSPETQAIVDLTEHGAADAPETGLDRLRPTRYVRSTSRAASLRIAAALGANIDRSLSPRELLQRMRNAPEPTTEAPAQPAASAMATVSSPKIETPIVLNPPTSRPTLSPRFFEACHGLLERLVFSPVATGEFPMPRSIAVVGITPGQGASTVAAHLAAALADHLPNGETEQSDSGRVLLVDANLASPAQHRVLDVQNEPGISEWIKQPSDGPALGAMVRHASVPKLDVLTAGSASIGHTPGRWAEAAMMTLEGTYNCVVLDLPPMAHAESAARVAGMCDAALLVVEGNHVNREVVRQAAHRLAESGVRLLGVVLNKRTYPIPEKLYRWI